MGEKQPEGFIPIGISSLLTIFGVLCLTVFALLTVSTARAGERLGSRTEQAVQNYYAADGQAEEILAALRMGEVPEGVVQTDGVWHYSCAISDTQTLMVEVEVQGTEYRILRWQAVPVGEWQADDRLPVWGGA